jgi:hypothetical protein
MMASAQVNLRRNIRVSARASSQLRFGIHLPIVSPGDIALQVLNVKSYSHAADRVTATGTARNVGDAQVAGRQPRNCASRGRRLTGSPVTESNLGLRAPAQGNRSVWRERFRGPAGSLLLIWMFCEQTRRVGRRPDGPRQ